KVLILEMLYLLPLIVTTIIFTIVGCKKEKKVEKKEKLLEAEQPKAPTEAPKPTKEEEEAERLRIIQFLKEQRDCPEKE
ncbi:hypothetical protein PFISCL1PPCAC_17160, partial [Pristionchus fissidentatus]